MATGVVASALGAVLAACAGSGDGGGAADPTGGRTTDVSPMKKAVRVAERIGDGDTVEVTLRVVA